VGVGGGGRVGLAEDAGRHFADDAGDQVAIALQAGKVEVAGLLQVHLAALDHRLQVALLDPELGHVRHQGLRHRVAGLAAKGLGDFLLPPGQLLGGHAHVLHLVHDIVHFAAERIERGDRGPAVGWQKEEGVIKAAARCGSFFLDVGFRIHMAGDCHMLGQGCGAGRWISARLDLHQWKGVLIFQASP